MLRGAGLRVGELLDLELGGIVDYGPAGTWLKVPLGKLATERMVPLSASTVAALDEWVSLRGAHRPLPHPRTGALTDFREVSPIPVEKAAARPSTSSGVAAGLKAPCWP